MSLSIINFEVFVLGTIFIVLLPGPNSLFVLTTSANQGIKAGYLAAGGIFIGDAILMLASVAGIAGLMRSFSPLFTALKVAGSLYLAWIGLNLLVDGLLRISNLLQFKNTPLSYLAKIRSNKRAAAKCVQSIKKNGFMQVLLLSLSNPKAILFFIAFFVQFVDIDGDNLVLSFLVLGIVVELFSAIYLTFLIFAGAYLAAWFARKRYVAAISISLAGMMFILFAWQLSVANL